MIPAFSLFLIITKAGFLAPVTSSNNGGEVKSDTGLFLIGCSDGVVVQLNEIRLANSSIRSFDFKIIIFIP